MKLLTWGGMFSSYIIDNRRNLKTFFEPIIDFIQIAKAREHMRAVYKNFISYMSNMNNPYNPPILMG